ncbi:MAG: TetR/AcrR family transcriptional regulator [Ilumatobacteraceae bacterium]
MTNAMSSANADLDTEFGEQTYPSGDGRHNRRVRNKIAVIDAYLDLIAEGSERPSVAEVAHRSGVSHRSVFRYFADKDDLARTSIDRQIMRVRPHLQLELTPRAPLADRVEHLLVRRFELYDVLGPVARLMRVLSAENPEIGMQLTSNRETAREQIRALFRPELDRLNQRHAENVLAVIDVLCSFESADLFSHDLRFSQNRSIDAIKPAVISLLN